ncbi:MAG: hypothetical protein HQK49_22935, partial [Oligoflexia bacterium]|nr:hypothetical protein [Oligoflexia bacterium]
MNLIKTDDFYRKIEINNEQHIKDIIGTTLFNDFTEIANKRKLNIDTAIKKHNAYLFVHDNELVLGIVNNICGKRFSVTGLYSNLTIFQNTKLLNILEYYAKVNDCDLMQILVGHNNNFDMGMMNIPGYYNSNLIFKNSLENIKSDTDELDVFKRFTSNNIKIPMDIFTTNEYLTRINHP